MILSGSIQLDPSAISPGSGTFAPLYLQISHGSSIDIVNLPSSPAMIQLDFAGAGNVSARDMAFHAASFIPFGAQLELDRRGDFNVSFTHPNYLGTIVNAVAVQPENTGLPAGFFLTPDSITLSNVSTGWLDTSNIWPGLVVNQ